MKTLSISEIDLEISAQENKRKRLYETVKDFSKADALKTDRVIKELAEVKAEIDKLLKDRKKAQSKIESPLFQERKKKFLNS